MESYEHQGPRIFTTWGKACGGFFSVKLGQRRVLVVNDGPLVKSLLVEKDQYNSSKVVAGGTEIALTDNGKEEREEVKRRKTHRRMIMIR